MVNYTLTVFRANGTTGRIWSFEAENDKKAKEKAARYLEEQATVPEAKAQLSKSDGKIKIDWER